MREPVQQLSDLPFFAGFAGNALAGLEALARWRGYRPGDIILEAGDASSDVYLVKDGVLRVYVRSLGGHELILNEIGAGALFGEIAALDGGPRSAGIMALTRAQICALPAQAFVDFVTQTPGASAFLLKRLAAQLRDKDQRLFELSVLPVRARLIGLLLRLARPRQNGGLIISPKCHHQELGARIGSRREVVSRNMSALQQEGLVQVTRGGLVLADPETLRRELDEAWRRSGSASNLPMTAP